MLVRSVGLCGGSVLRSEVWLLRERWVVIILAFHLCNPPHSCSRPRAWLLCKLLGIVRKTEFRLSAGENKGDDTRVRCRVRKIAHCSGDGGAVGNG